MDMQRFRLFVFLAAVIAAVPIFGVAATREVRPAIVAGQVVNRSPEDPAVLTWNLCDPFNDYRVGVRLSADGSFRLMSGDGVNMFHNMTLNYGCFINFFMAPGDSVHLVIDAGKLRAGDRDAVRFGGSYAELNAQLYPCHDYMIGILNADREPLEVSAEPQVMLAALKVRLARYADSLAVYGRKNPIDSRIHDFMKRDMLFSVANQLLDYRRDDPAARLALFSDPMFGIHDPANFCTMMFPYHLSAYMQTKTYADPAIIAAGKNGDFAVAARDGIRMLLEERASGSRDVMLWQYLSNILDNWPALCDSVPEAAMAFLDPELGARLEAIGATRAEAPSFPETPINGVAYLTADSIVKAVPEGDVFVYLAKRYPGKVLYVDVYATWCGPCRVEMKEAPALHRLLEGRDVVFVNLCLGSEAAAWRKLVAQADMQGEHYWFDRDATQLFLGTYSLSGYPTYILVGRDGKIATMQASRPSELTQAVQEIERLL